MRLGYVLSPSRKAGVLLAVLLLACLVAIPLTAACGGEEEETPTPSGTPTAEVTGTATPEATATEAAAPGKVDQGITDTEIMLGADCILSGTSGAVYSMIPRAQEAYFKYVNDTEGGVCGRKIVYKVEDNQDDPAKAVEVARKLVEDEEVFAIVGSLGDTPHPAVWEYLNDNQVPDILVSAGSHMFGDDPEGHPWTVQMIPSYRVEATFFGEYISENLPGKKVGVLRSNDRAGNDCLQGVKDGLDPDKNEIVSEQSYEAGTITVRSQIANMHNDGVEVFVTNGNPGVTAQAVKEADRLGWYPDWFISYINSDETMFQFVSPELLEGAISFQALKLAGWTDDPAIALHYDIMRDYGGPSPTNFSVYAQSVAEVAVEALSRTCDNLTHEGLMDAIHSIKDWRSDLFIEGVSVSFSEEDHTGLQTGRMLLATLEDGTGNWEYFGPLFEFEVR